MTDPRNPKRPDGTEGDNWARCGRCGRGAEKARLIRHSKACCATGQAVPVIVARVVNDRGLAFNVRLVRRGDRYGLDDCLVHDKDDPLVEFWDATYEDDPRFTPGLGQFASRYFLRTLTGEDGYRTAIRGIALCGHVPAWTVTAGNVVDAVAAALAALDRGCQKSAPGGVI